MADFISDRLLGRINWQATYTNGLTAGNPAGARIPMHFPTDRTCLESIAMTVGRADPGQMTVCWITDTLQLGVLGLSENLLGEIRRNPALEVASPPMPLPFDAEGSLPSLRQLEAGRTA